MTDLPSSHDIASAQQHLRKGALREMHWHRVMRNLFVPLRDVMGTMKDGADEQ